jgi:hypothetical protein
VIMRILRSRKKEEFDTQRQSQTLYDQQIFKKSKQKRSLVGDDRRSFSIQVVGVTAVSGRLEGEVNSQGRREDSHFDSQKSECEVKMIGGKLFESVRSLKGLSCEVDCPFSTKMGGRVRSHSAWSQNEQSRELEGKPIALFCQKKSVL